MNTLCSFALTAIRKKCKTLQNKIQISFCTEKYKSCETALMLNWALVLFFFSPWKKKAFTFRQRLCLYESQYFLVLFAFLFCFDNAFYRFNAVNGTHKRMIKHNAWSWITHHFFNFHSHIGFVAMAGTLRAEVFIVSPAAMVKPEKRIISKFLAVLAKSTFFWFMHTVAINFYHFG